LTEGLADRANIFVCGGIEAHSEWSKIADIP
jgi:hypothetical protein